jgi:peptidyl-prolyl cis-trans isomerase B (cyclophilin B)
MKKTLLTSLLILTLILSFGCRTKDGSGQVSTEAGTAESYVDNRPLTHPTMQLQPETGDTIATIKTSHGNILVLLYTEETPNTTENFIELSKQGKYDDVPFHRIIEDFMIQTGDFENQNGSGGHSFKGPGTLLDDELVEELKHVQGALSMAKTPAPDSAGSQFFIVHPEDGTHFLDGVHSVFGYVYDGMGVVDKIAKVPTGFQDKPEEDADILSVEIGTF